jgi:polyisoprenoid-binding protein YceI
VKKLILFAATSLLIVQSMVLAAALPMAEKAYKIDRSKSNFIVKVGTAGLLGSSLGHNHTIKISNFNGEAKVNADAIEQSSLTLNVETASLRVVDNDVSDADRKEVQSTMEKDVLEISKFSSATFRSTRVAGVQRNGNDAKLTLEGDLDLHGVVHHISIPMTVSLNGSELRARGEFGLKQTDYKIQPVTAGLGSIKVKDEVRISFEIVAR